jgi:AraC-like DNA-binding protein
MNQLVRNGIYSSGQYLLVENLKGSGLCNQRIENAGCLLDVSINGSVIINGLEMKAGQLRLQHQNAGERQITAMDRSSSDFLSIGINENPYASKGIHSFPIQKTITTEMAYPLVKIISLIKEDKHDTAKDIWLKCYIQLLLRLSEKSKSPRCPFNVSELMAIYRLFSEIRERKAIFPSPSKLIHLSGMNKSRFQKACFVIYGQSAQKIIQHLKMSRAFDFIVNERRDIESASTLLGYKYSPNFITAFKNHFSLTPFDAVHLQDS